MPLVRIWTFDGALASGIAAPVDIFMAANHVWARRDGQHRGGPLFKWRLESPDGKPVRTASGQIMPVDGHISGSGTADAIWLTGAFVSDIQRFLDSPEPLRPLLAALKRQHEKGTLLATYCTGAFLLAEAGLLDGRIATTHWSKARTFEARYPEVQLRASEILTEQSGILCSGAVTSYQNLALRLIEKLADARLASATAKLMLIDTNRISQDSYAHFRGRDGLDHDDELVSRAQRWMETNLRESFSVSKLSRHLAVSERTINRRFKQALGVPPLKHLQALRVEVAKRLLEGTRLTVDAASERVGYGDLSTFRQLFKRETGVSPTEYRRRFGRTPAQATGRR